MKAHKDELVWPQPKIIGPDKRQYVSVLHHIIYKRREANVKRQKYIYDYAPKYPDFRVFLW